MRTLQCLLILLVVLLPAGPFATTFPVTKTEDTDDGTCGADCSLREAIDAANTNLGADDVPVPAGTYLLTLGQLTVSDAVSIAGVGQTNTIIDGNAANRVLDIEATSGVVAISGVTIRNGHASLYTSGGGIRSSHVDLTLTDSTVSGNTGARGGGISISYGALTLINSTVSGNIVSGLGGGIASSAALTLTNSTVSGNTSLGAGGGGIEFYIGVYRSTVGLTLINSTVSGNTTDGFGGGIYHDAYYGVLKLTNSTVSGNSANQGGAGIFMNTTATFTDTIIADNGTNTPNCFRKTFGSLGYNLTDDTSCGFTEVTDLVVADAMLGPLQDNGGPTETHDLLDGSPAIDAGSADCPPPATDQRGVARPQGAGCDIGSVESMSAPPPTPTPTATPTPTPTPTATFTPKATPIPLKKVAMCHHGKHSISASANAVPAHLAHGDTLGACP